mgnify:CR=1 FL=1
MLDPKLIRSDLHAVAEQLKKRNFELDVEALEKAMAGWLAAPPPDMREALAQWAQAHRIALD